MDRLTPEILFKILQKNINYAYETNYVDTYEESDVEHKKLLKYTSDDLNTLLFDAEMKEIIDE